jgi:hypothetical protein
MLARRLILPSIFGAREPRHAFVQDEAVNALLAADLAAGILDLRPDDEDIGDRAVGDPHLAAGQQVAATVTRHRPRA